MDNAKVHHSPVLLEVCTAAGVQIEYLPPYSPDLNPIETSFALLKAYIRRHTEEAQLWASSDQFGEFLNNAVRSQMAAFSARRLYSNSGIQYHENGYCVGEIDESDNSEDSEVE
jgi:transposase